MAEPHYIRLARPRLRSGFQAISSTRSSLWLGQDHLLCVETNGYMESYKRFYFRDIQSISLRRTRSYLVANVVLLPLTLLFVGLAVAVQDPVGRIVLGCLSIVPMIPLIVNLFRGPSCRCRICTAVQEEEIPALANVRQALAILGRVRPLIASAQGVLNREDLPARLEELAARSRPRLVVDDPGLPPRMVN